METVSLYAAGRDVRQRIEVARFPLAYRCVVGPITHIPMYVRPRKTMLSRVPATAQT